MLSKPTHDIGNTSSSNNNKCNLKERNDSTSRIFNKLVNALNLNEFKPFALRSAKSNTNLRNSSISKAHLSRSIGNITESHYDTIFNTDSYVIARGITTTSSRSNNNNYDEEEEHFINDRECPNNHISRIGEDVSDSVNLLKNS